MTRPLLLTVIFATLLADGVCAQSPPMQKAEDSARAVSKQLRTHMTPTPGVGWNEFQLRIVDSIGKDDFATTAGWEDWGDGKPTPFVTITRGYLVVAKTPDALALIIGRELARLSLGLAPPKGEPRSDATDADADLYAVKLVLRSGYSVRRGLAGMLLEKGRPAWADRIAKLLEKPDESLWRIMPAFESGMMFLAIEQHTNATACFEVVTKEFPLSHEAWANLGYARLMHYFDYSSAVRSGHVLGTSHIRSSVKATSPDKEQWASAVRALQEAEKLKPGQPRVLANLGLAYTIPPNGVPHAEDAEKYLVAALTALKEQPNPSLAGEIELLVNVAVVRISTNKTADARKVLDQAAALATKLPGGPPARYTQAITFNRALALAADGKPSEAIKLLVRFLETTQQYDPWWSEGYQHYLVLCKQLKLEPRPRDALRKPTKQQLQTATLASGKTVRPGNAPDDVLSMLGKPSRQSPIAPRISLLRWSLDTQGIELIVQPDEEVLVVVLVSKKSGVPWPKTGPCGRPAGDLRVGMSREQVEALPGGADFALRPFAPQTSVYAYYPEWDLTVVYDRDGTDGVVKAIIVGSGKE
ncbi:MAG: hypothetical protein C0467_20405 [Planctomycetaceae bacterium]|nr:hypothetical protein [Planctomycetaceae bacterium]